MELFKNSNFWSSTDELRATYEDGVRALHSSDFYLASAKFNEASKMGHPSAFYNLSIIHGSGYVSPFDIDFATECRREAAEAGHPGAMKEVGFIDAADRGGFGIANVTNFARACVPQERPNPLLMIYACRFYRSTSLMHRVIDEVAAWELGKLSMVDDVSVDRFVKRVNISPSKLSGYDMMLQDDSDPFFDQIVDGLDELYRTMIEVGYHRRTVNFVRCSVTGYLIGNSALGGDSEPLLGMDKFFSH